MTDDAELTREELQELVDELGQQAYRAEDRLAFVREMCEAADREQRTVTTGQVRAWTNYEGCGGAIVLPEEVAQRVLTDRENWLDLAKQTVLAAERQRQCGRLCADQHTYGPGCGMRSVLPGEER